MVFKANEFDKPEFEFFDPTRDERFHVDAGRTATRRASCPRSSCPARTNRVGSPGC